MSVSEKIKGIINNRKKNLPLIDEKIKYLESLKNDVKELEEFIGRLKELPDIDPIMVDNLFSSLNGNDLTSEISKIVLDCEAVRKRLDRDRINLGISGQARVGKSTLLQNISGLSDDEVPTGKGLPVTAVRSKIYNSNSYNRAIIELRTFNDFKNDVLDGYHSILPESYKYASSTIEEYQNFRYPKFEDIENEVDDNKKATVNDILPKLIEMQERFSTYKDLLKGGELEIKNLSELRPFVAYPTNKEKESGNFSRKDLAVKDIRIEVKFPQVDVQELGLIDLPGLGENDPNIDKIHVNGFKNEVDFVIMLKKPTETKGFWEKQDVQCLDMLSDAKGHFGKSGDFVAIGVNKADGDDKNIFDGLMNNIKNSVGKNHNVYVFNAIDGKSVRENLLNPILKDISEKLPGLDQELIDITYNSVKDTSKRILNRIMDVDNYLKSNFPTITSSAEERDRLTRKLIDNISNDLQIEIVEPLLKKARRNEDKDREAEDEGFLEEVEKIHNEIKDWIVNKFGMDDWEEDALKKMKRHQGYAEIANEKIQGIRVEISKRYIKLNPYFKLKISSLWDDIVNVLRRHLGELIPLNLEGRDALQHLKAKLEEASEECPKLSEAIENLLNLEIEYRSHLHPRVREALDCLFLTKTVGDEEVRQIEDITQNEEGVRLLLSKLQDLAKKSATDIKTALFKEAGITLLVLHSAAEQFEDTIIREKDIDYEYHRMTRSYLNEIWPDKFKGIDIHNSNISRINKKIKEIRDNIENKL